MESDQIRCQSCGAVQISGNLGVSLVNSEGGGILWGRIWRTISLASSGKSLIFLTPQAKNTIYHFLRLRRALRLASSICSILTPCDRFAPQVSLIFDTSDVV